MLHSKLAGALLVFSFTAWGQTACDQIKSLAFPDTVITTADVVAAGPYKPPAAPGPGGPALDLPAHCRIAATLKPSSDSEIGHRSLDARHRLERKIPSRRRRRLGRRNQLPSHGPGPSRSYGDSLYRHRPSKQLGRCQLRPRPSRKNNRLLLPCRPRNDPVKAKAMDHVLLRPRPAPVLLERLLHRGPPRPHGSPKIPEDFDGIIAGAPANYQTHLHAWSVAMGVAALKDKTSNLSHREPPPAAWKPC